MKATTHLLERGIQLTRAGNQADARRLFEAVIRQEPGNEQAWLWYAETYTQLDKRITLLEQFLAIDPSSARVRRILAWLKAQAHTAPATQPQPARAPEAQTLPVQPVAAQAQPAPARPQPAGRGSQASARRAAPPKSAKPAQAPARPARQARAAGYPGHLITALVLILGAGAMALSLAFTLYQEYTGLRKDYAAMETKVQEFQVANTGLRESNTQLNGENAGLKEENGALEVEKEALNHQVLQEQEQNRLHTEQIEALVAEKTDLSNQVVQFQEQNSAQAAEIEELKERQKTLRHKINTLEDEKQALGDAYSSLEAEYSYLSTEYRKLEDRIAYLEANAVTAPFIVLRGRTVYVSFFRQNGARVDWQLPFDDLQAAVVRGEARRKNPRRLMLENAQGSTGWITDPRDFIETEALTRLATDLYNANPDEEAFITEVWRLIGQVVAYTDDGQYDTPRLPLETLLSGGGDCEDTAILFASLIKAAPLDWRVDIVLIDSQQLQEPQNPSHVIVHVRTGSRDYYVETTNQDVMQPYGKFSGWYLEVD